jgi:hypothetical protein
VVGIGNSQAAQCLRQADVAAHGGSVTATERLPGASGVWEI